MKERPRESPLRACGKWTTGPTSACRAKSSSPTLRRLSTPSCSSPRSREEARMPELWELSAEEMARRVRAREVSASEVAEASLARTARVEPLIAAYLDRFEDEARARAAELD